VVSGKGARIMTGIKRAASARQTVMALFLSRKNGYAPSRPAKRANGKVEWPAIHGKI